MAADARVQALLDADDTADLPLEYLRLLQARLPERFAVLVARLEADVRLDEVARERVRARVVVLAEETRTTSGSA